MARPAGQGEHLLLAAGHRPGELDAPLAEPGEAGVGQLLDLVEVGGAGEGDHPQVLPHGEVREDATPLGDRAHADPGQGVGLAPLTWRPAMWTQPAVGVSWPRDHLQRRRLARRRSGPSRATTLPGGHDEVDAVQHLDAPVGGPHAAQLEQRRLGPVVPARSDGVGVHAHPAPR